MSAQSIRCCAISSSCGCRAGSFSLRGAGRKLVNLSDRIAVLYEGRIMGVIDNDKVDIDQIGLLMGGRTQAREVA